jgi:hypothetical protein
VIGLRQVDGMAGRRFVVWGYRPLRPLPALAGSGAQRPSAFGFPTGAFETSPNALKVPFGAFNVLKGTFRAARLS